MPFNLVDYEPVEERLARFWKDYPNGRIYTAIITEKALETGVIMAAEVFKNMDDEHPAASGHAQETPGSNPVNKTSWIENCETSAIGRALANMGYAPKGHRPSREEMAKAAAPSQDPPPARRRTKPRASHIRLFEAAKDANVDEDLRHRVTRMFTGKTSTKELTDDEADKVTKQLAWLSVNRASALEALAKWEAENGLS